MSVSFSAEVFQNAYLTQGANEVHAIMTVTGEGAATGQTSQNRVFGILCDTSGSMQGAKLHAAKEAMQRLIQLLPEDALFFLIAGTGNAKTVLPVTRATPESKWLATKEIRALEAHGGTVISTWLAAAREQFQHVPGTIRQALLLTDGENDDSDENELTRVLATCEGLFQCDCRGVGTSWRVGQLKQIAGKLLGTTDIIPNETQMDADFQSILAKAMSKSVSDVAIRLWSPAGAKVLYCKQVSPEVVDLTARGRPVKPQVMDFPTGAWGARESRDYHFCIQVKPGKVGDEMLAGRASLICMESGCENKVAEARILAVWTEDEAKSAKIDRRVAHYTGQAELAESIQAGLEARARGEEDRATALLGKAVKLAHDSGHESTAKLLRTVVDVDDPATGTIRLKRNVAKADEMALETRSTKTSRLQKA